MVEARKILTVTELTAGIKELLDTVFFDVCVTGEVSNLRRPASGHIYFSLKDAQSQIRCVLFKGQTPGVKFHLRDGMQLLCTGRVSVYSRDGQYQLYVRGAEPKGKGSLQLAFEQLKERLAREGLFEEARKRLLPFLPKRIGIVTSPTGAVIRDILHVLNRRFPAVHVIIAPVRVQGEGAKEEIVRALALMNSMDNIDVIILARGGGSLEDLWSFNEELVARAIATSRIPVISAVGHETDYTIADFVADRRAPTPSSAAEIVMPARAELDEKINSLLLSLQRHLLNIVPQHEQHVDDLLIALERYLCGIVPQYGQRLDDLRQDLERAVSQVVMIKESRLDAALSRLHALSPLAVLRRGYSVTLFAESGRLLHSADSLKKGDRLRTRLSTGEFESEVLAVSSGRK